MKAYQSLFLAALLVVLLSCPLHAQKQYECEIYGKLNPLPSSNDLGTITVHTPDFFNKTVYQAEVQKDGTYQIRFQKYFAGIVLFQYGQKSANIFIHPGEKLEVNFDPTNFKNTQFELMGNAALFNRAMGAWEKQRISDNKFVKLMKELDFGQVQDSVTRFKREEMKRLQKFCLSHQCPSEFLRWARLDILYREANELMRFRWYQPLLNKQSPLKVIPKGYNYQFTRKFSLNQLLALHSQNYLSYIHEHNKHWHYIAYSKKVLHPDAIDPKKELDWILQNIEPGLARDLMLAENYGVNVQNKSKNLIKQLTPLFLAQMQYQPAKDYIQRLAQRRK